MNHLAVIQWYLAIDADNQNDTDRHMISEALLYKCTPSSMSPVVFMGDWGSG